MNKKWIDFVNKINAEISILCKTHWYDMPRYNWGDSLVQERIMRLWIEARLFELDTNNNNELETIAIATLREDFIKNNTK